MAKVKGLVVFGTRPEAIKMCPLVRELKGRDWMETRVCVTGQHREMLDQVLEVFSVHPDYDLSIMKPRQTLFSVAQSTLTGMETVLNEYQPDIVFVHGDTSTAFIAALSAFYMQIPVAHIEAGLRTHDIYSPFPEEFNRQGIGLIARWNFAPTFSARQNLLSEGKRPDSIFVTGNTGIDALSITVRPDYKSEYLDWAAGSRLILMTSHRRENLGDTMHGMFRAIRRAVEETPDVKLLYPVHKNPAVREAAEAELSGCSRIRLIEPMNAVDFHCIMERSFLILTDSGGIQEEAPFFNKPVLVMRKETERPEGVAAGTLRLIGTEENSVYEGCRLLLDDPDVYAAMARAKNPYGDGTASIQIADILERELACK